MTETLNDGHWVEALHATNMAETIVETHVRHHPAIAQTPELAAKADAVLEALGELYQAVGQAAPESGRE